MVMSNHYHSNHNNYNDLKIEYLLFEHLISKLHVFCLLSYATYYCVCIINHTICQLLVHVYPIINDDKRWLIFI